MSQMHEQERRPFQELTFGDAEFVRDRLTDAFRGNFVKFFIEDDRERLLILLKFVKGTDLVSYRAGEEEFGLEYGDLGERFEAVFEDYRSRAFPPTTLRDYKTLPDKEHIPYAGLKDLAGKRVSLVSTNYPFSFRLNDGSGVAVLDEEYRSPESLASERLVELWSISKIHLSEEKGVKRSSDRRLTVPTANRNRITTLSRRSF